jgi:hypothetical protein
MDMLLDAYFIPMMVCIQLLAVFALLFFWSYACSLLFLNMHRSSNFFGVLLFLIFFLSTFLAYTCTFPGFWVFMLVLKNLQLCLYFRESSFLRVVYWLLCIQCLLLLTISNSFIVVGLIGVLRCLKYAVLLCLLVEVVVINKTSILV